MALIQCPECGRDNVSDSADSCPNCGYGIKRHFDNIKLQEENTRKKQVEEEQKQLEQQRLDKERLEQKRLKQENEAKKREVLQQRQTEEIKKLDKQWRFRVKMMIISIVWSLLATGVTAWGVVIMYPKYRATRYEIGAVIMHPKNRVMSQGIITTFLTLAIIGCISFVVSIVKILRLNSTIRLCMNDIEGYLVDKGLDRGGEHEYEYEQKLEQWCNSNAVIFKDNSELYKSVKINGKYGHLWFSNKDIVFCPRSNYFDRPINIWEQIIYVKYEDIQYFTKDGSIEYTNEIVNSGSNISVSGAIIGGIIAGEVGAIIGSRKDMNQFKNITVRHDEVHTYVYFNHYGKLEVLDVEGNDVYQVILQLMPEKEYNYLLSKQNNQ